MATQRRVPKIRFRVLVIGRANAGKTSILQRVCDTTESPKIYRGMDEVQLDPSMERGEHRITDEIVFTNHTGYVFHDSCGFEAGSEDELKIVQEFIQKKCSAKQLQNRLHAIWYCVPMDNDRASLDLRHLKDICPDQNVPVVVVFTKYDQFKKNVKMKLQDEDYSDWKGKADEETERRYKEEYLSKTGETARVVRLEGMHKREADCIDLIEITANALNDGTVVLMFLAVQRGNLELSIKVAAKR